MLRLKIVDIMKSQTKCQYQIVGILNIHSLARDSS